ncbi:MAG TPA: EAL domain-containing protein [Acetobacteraceae bacterium]|nr:EAL domain-containing protein [Acetobacteraceae bacterium]
MRAAFWKRSDGEERTFPAGAVKPVLLAAIVALALGAAFTSVLIVDRQRTLSRVSRYNVTWDASQTLAEILRLETTVAAYAVPEGGSTKDQVQLRLQIVISRLSLLLNGQVNAVVEREPDLRLAVAELADAIQKIQVLAPEIDQPGRVRDILDLLTPLNSKMARLASAANILGADQVAKDQRELSRIHWIFSSMLGGVILCAVGLVLLLLRHNELLGRAERKLRALASNLELAGLELVAANRAVREANAELQAQNLTLQDRDRELRVQNERFDAALNNMSQGLCMADAEGRVTVYNRQFAELFGLTAESIRPGDAVLEIIRTARPDSPLDQTLFTTVAARQRALASLRQSGDFFCEGDAGRVIAVLQRPMLDGGWVATYEDVTDRRRVEERIRHMAHHDALTNLPNRVLLRERMDDALRFMSQNEGVAILLLDLDFFKDVNDTLGHPAGDALLEIVAHRLRGCVCRQDIVARLGGDEFAILQTGVRERADVATRAERILAVLQKPYDLDGHRVTIMASVGIAIAPENGASADQLMKSADMALYRAKARGRATYCFFEAQMEADMQERRLLGFELREALLHQDFEVFYQPIVSLQSTAPVGFEALIRWRHRERGMIPPDQFIGLAEEMGLIGALGEWTLRQACADCASWPDGLRVSVNLSPRQFNGSNLTQAVQGALDAAKLPSSRLDLEITESVMLQENEGVLSTLHELRGRGIRIALDDFGIGYSSLSYLRRFPLDKIKVDRSFVQGMADDPDSFAIVQSIADLAPKLGMCTIAEGIETIRDLEQVRRAGCEEGQGYLFGRPMRRADVTEYLRSHEKAATSVGA